MFRRKRILYLGSISILLLSGLLFVAHTKLAPTAHAATCSTVAQGATHTPQNYYLPDWHDNCGVSQTDNSDSNFVLAIQEIVNGYLGTDAACDTPLTLDGDFGPKTQTAVACFQKKEGLSYTGGAVGSATWDRLASYVGSNPCSTQSCQSSDWQYFSAYGPTGGFADFRVYIPTLVWYVFPSGGTQWCQMNTGDSC